MRQAEGPVLSTKKALGSAADPVARQLLPAVVNLWKPDALAAIRSLVVSFVGQLYEILVREEVA